MFLSVTQKHGAGCAVACVAYILNVSYNRALKLFSRPTQAIDRGFTCREIILALKRSGCYYSYVKVTPFNKRLSKIPGAIVFIDRSKKYPIGHFLVNTEDRSWMNPWINFPSIAPAISGFQKRLPGTAAWIIYPKGKEFESRLLAI